MEENDKLISDKNKDEEKQNNVQTEQEEAEETCGDTICELFPLLICLTFILIILIWLLVDWSSTIRFYHAILAYIKEHPLEAAFIIIFVYILLVVLILPIAFLHIIVAFAYCKVFHDIVKGFAVATTVIFIGVMLGALFAFLLGRYLLYEYVKRKIQKSKSPWAKKFKVADSMFAANGIILVGLLRLMFLPFGITSYLLAITCLTIIDYVIGNTFYIIKIMLFVTIGCTIYLASETSSSDNPDETPKESKTDTIVIIVVEICLTVIVTIIITCWAKSYFEKALDEAEKEEQKKLSK